jgi:hypothetical protein
LNKRIFTILILSLFAFSVLSAKEPGKSFLAFATGNGGRKSVTEQNRSEKSTAGEEIMKISIQIQSDSGSHALTATLSDNSSAKAFYELVKKGAVTIRMSDYGSFEKVGPLGTTLPRNDRQITTGAGDIILYQGNQITIYYDTNSWNFTRLGKVDGMTQSELKQVLGKGNVTATFSIE